MKVRSWLPGGTWEVNEWLAANKWQHGSGGRWHFSRGGSAPLGKRGIVLKGLRVQFLGSVVTREDRRSDQLKRGPTLCPQSHFLSQPQPDCPSYSQVDQVGLELHYSSKGTWANALGFFPWDRAGQAGANGPKFFFQRKEDCDWLCTSIFQHIAGLFKEFSWRGRKN